MEASVPQCADRLAALSAFVRAQAGQIERGLLQEGQTLDRRIRDFCAGDQMDAIERVAPGWQAMAAFADGATLVHVVRAMIALQLLPEFRTAPPQLQALMEWSVLYHDLGKQVVAGKRDALHAFRSATFTARALPQLGFATTNVYPETLERWARRVLEAFIPAPDGEGFIQDNRALPQILAGGEQLFGRDSAAGLIVQAVLLHQSLNVVAEWPNAASLTEAEIPLCISPALLPLLEGVMLVDSDAWQLFDPPRKAHFRQSTLSAFARVRQRVAV